MLVMNSTIFNFEDLLQSRTTSSEEYKVFDMSGVAGRVMK